jgi:hypothetical protein
MAELVSFLERTIVMTMFLASFAGEQCFRGFNSMKFASDEIRSDSRMVFLKAILLLDNFAFVHRRNLGPVIFQIGRPKVRSRPKIELPLEVL